MAGKTVDRGVKRWSKDPEPFWQEVKELNDLFVKKAALEIERVKTELAANPPRLGTVRPKRPEDVVFAKHRNLKKWLGGFFTLEWALVKQLHDNGFIWGATFRNAVDLHHFEL